MEFKRGNSNRKKCIALTLEFSKDYKYQYYKYQLLSIIRLKITEYLPVFKYKNKYKYLKYLKI